MPKGRKPKPISEHIANGTFRPSRHDNRILSPEAIKEVPDVPDYLPSQCHDDWQHVCSILLGHGLLTNNDLHTIEAYCVMRLQYRIAIQSLQDEGQIITELNGNGMTVTKINPSWKALMEAQREVRAIQDRLGFNPYTRQKLTLTKEDDVKDPSEGLF
jgi:P27 family predicted phage terminase small subunit